MNDPEEAVSVEAKRRKTWKIPPTLSKLSPEESTGAFSHLRMRVNGQLEAKRLAETVKAKPGAGRADPEVVRSFLELVRALRRGGRINYAEYVGYVGHRVEWIVEDRWAKGQYAEELDPIAEAMDEVERRHGLTDQQFWLLGDAPKDYQVLNDAYSAVLIGKLPDALREFGEDELAELASNDRARFDELCEHGRLARFEAENSEAALATLIMNYEDEAQRATSAGAFLAGCLMWGAAAEARLLLQCLQKPEEAAAARTKLPGKLKPKGSDPKTWTLEGLVHVTATAGWIGTIEDDSFTYRVDALVQQLRGMRNLIHPGRHVEELPHLRVDEAICADARAAYLALCIAS